MHRTTSPASGTLAGAATTAIIQSSSATMVTAVGFVGAGLLTFPQALGVIFGANVGTTVTGWLVALFGFKLRLTALVLPLVLAGALLRMFGPGRMRHLGMAVAGFSLLFIGIDMLQQGLTAFQGSVTPDVFPPDTPLGRLQLIGLGILITLVTQSSSAGVAAAMVALGTDTISFPQAAAMIIGMDVGTTVTAVLATIGGSTAMRQTAFAHVLYNVMTAVIAFWMLTPWFHLTAGWLTGQEAGDAQLALVAFHTAFNILGVGLALAFTGTFTRVITALVPSTGAPLTKMLDDRLLADPRAATDAAAATLRQVAERLANALTAALNPKSPASGLERVTEALEPVQGFLDRIHVDGPPGDLRARRATLVHILRPPHAPASSLPPGRPHRGDARLTRLAGLLRTVTHEAAAHNGLAAAEARFERLQALLLRQYHRYRDRAAATAELGGEPDILDRLDSAHWLYRAAHHLWRIAVHLHRDEQATLAAQPEPGSVPAGGAAVDPDAMPGPPPTP